jgi:hypothetical protein
MHRTSRRRAMLPACDKGANITQPGCQHGSRGLGRTRAPDLRASLGVNEYEPGAPARPLIES